MSAEEAARLASYRARRTFQRGLDAALEGDATALAEVEADWEPIRLLITEGPDVGEPDVPEADLESEERWKERPNPWL